ncbi:MAG: MASE1 domain-containing protein [Actinobacteria bacterium]|nr:MASE1 domain-containing protein [Actinomycetota bacterium]
MSAEAAAKTPSDWRSARFVLPILAVGAAYYVAAELGLRLALVEDNVTPLWAPTGIAVVGFLLFGRRVLPGVALAAFLVNLPISTELWAAAVTAAGNTLAPFAAAEGLRKVGFRRQLDRTRDAMAIIAAALGGMVISATVGAGTLVLSDAIPSGSFPATWSVWWTGDALGVLVFAPFLLSLRRYEEQWSPWRWIEAVALLAVLTAVSLLVFRSDLGLKFLLMPLLG